MINPIHRITKLEILTTDEILEIFVKRDLKVGELLRHPDYDHKVVSNEDVHIIYAEVVIQKRIELAEKMIVLCKRMVEDAYKRNDKYRNSSITTRKEQLFDAHMELKSQKIIYTAFISFKNENI